MSDVKRSLYGSFPPQDIEAEIFCLAACLVDPNAFDNVFSVIQSGDDFYDPKHSLIFSAMLALVDQNKAVDYITVADYLSKKNLLERAGGKKYLDFLIENASVSNCTEYAMVVSEKSLLRQLKKSSTIMERVIQSESLKIEEKVERCVDSILSLREKAKKRDFEQIGAIASKIGLFSKSKINQLSVKTGFQNLDELVSSGFRPGSFIILGARPSMGKTAFSLALALNAGLNKKSVAFFSLEMSTQELCSRMLCSVGKINSQRLNSGLLSEADKQRLQNSYKSISDAKIFIDDTGDLTVAEIRAKLRLAEKRHGKIDLVIIDYLQLIVCSERKENKVQEVSEISRQLKNLAKDFECPIIALSQLSRAVENRADKRPLLSDLRESGSIEQDADIVMFLYRDEYYNHWSEDRGVAEVIVGKNRNGPVGTVKLLFEKETGCFLEKIPSFNE